MPTYDYVCDNGHTHEWARSMADRDAPLDCLSCGAPTRRGINRAVNTTLREGQRALTGDKAFTVHVKGANRDYPVVQCTVCTWTDTVVVENDAPLLGCAECGSEVRRVLGVPSAESMLQFPRYDKGLGLLLESEQHRRRVMKERGLIEMGEYDEDKLMASIEKEGEEDDRIAAEYFDKLENSPEFADYRHLRAAGRYDEVLKREPPPMASVPLRGPGTKKRRVVR